tara:strand:+ start:655 stop:846 length:192 start_codon:yes stop_codon:yes gene_type:complete
MNWIEIDPALAEETATAKRADWKAVQQTAGAVIDDECIRRDQILSGAKSVPVRYCLLKERKES